MGSSIGGNFFNASGCGGTGNCAGGCDPCGTNNCSSNYVRAFAGWSAFHDASVAQFDDGWTGGFAAGRRFGNRRVELEFSHRHNSATDGVSFGNLSTVSGMVNVLFDLDILTINGWELYAGAGLGLTYGDFHQVSPVDSAEFETAFSYQGIVGFDKQLTNRTKGFVEYRYQGEEFDVGQTFDLGSNSVIFGVELAR